MSLDKVLLGAYPSLESDVSTDGLDINESTVENEVQAAADVNEESNVNEELNESIEETETLEDAAESLESYIAVLSNAKQQGGLTVREMAMISLGINNSLRHAKITSKDVGGYALESYDATTERERICQTESVENALTDALKKIWEAIKRTIRKVINFVRKWYLKIFDGASRLKRQAQALRKKADDTTGTIKEKKIRTGVLNTLHISGNMPTASEIIKSIEILSENTSALTDAKLSKNYEDSIVIDWDKISKQISNESYTYSLENSISNAEKDKLKKLREKYPDKTDEELVKLAGISNMRKDAAKKHLEELANKAIQPNNEMANAAKSNSSKANVESYGEPYRALLEQQILKPEDFDIFKSEVLAGNYTIQFMSVKDNIFSGNINDDFEDLVNRVNKVSGLIFKVIFVEAEKRKREIDESKEVATLSSSDVSQIAQAVVELCDVVIDYKKAFEKYEKIDERALKSIDKVTSSKLDSYAEDPVSGKLLRTTARIVENMIKNTNSSITTLINRGLTTSRAALSYGSQSLSQYKND